MCENHVKRGQSEAPGASASTLFPRLDRPWEVFFERISAEHLLSALSSVPVLRMRAPALRSLRRVIPFRPPASSCSSALAPNRSGIVRNHVPSFIPWHRQFSASTPTRFILDGDSTIYVLSTAPGRAAIAVVRASGPGCVQVCPR
ncbi:hypothetical protein P170DRAFT_185416 [Aspergillus steynii IBT 23096]|uniref:Uncharacterized protein n=1 Tax=Aspergillus steynii IBT 23096 TaxID=1392250 RepID=A0A2I2G9F8_9EURO|nr:uncharacterized protein P170DRAFT_185416 [Aspergillus steynii IBT 23096]PLB49511.1 hypothetical protein P170DRAFT_185416 [Aspergillus steynii IBT 23096]